VEFPVAQRSQLLPQPSSSDSGGGGDKRERGDKLTQSSSSSLLMEMASSKLGLQVGGWCAAKEQLVYARGRAGVRACWGAWAAARAQSLPGHALFVFSSCRSATQGEFDQAKLGN